jgi:hypothetical protein
MLKLLKHSLVGRTAGLNHAVDMSHYNTDRRYNQDLSAPDAG